MNSARCCARVGYQRLRPVATTTTVASRSSSQASRLISSKAEPLFLDFLAPSWVAHRRRDQSPIHHRPNTASEIPSIAKDRHFSTGTRRQATAITNARVDDEGREMLINITPRAAHRLQAIAEKDKNNELALRVSVESGGCHGFQYLMKLINMPEVDQAEDTVFENEDGGSGGYRARVVMDKPSLDLLKGSSIDYTMELIGSQFKVTGIPGAKSSCGCGTSFDIAE